MQKKAPMGPHKLLKVCNDFFFGVLGLAGTGAEGSGKASTGWNGSAP